MPWLITPEQLDKFRKNQKNVLIFDATYHHANTYRDARQEFLEEHIVDAQFFAIDDFSDPQCQYPHQLLQDVNLINEKLGALGIRNDCKIIFYDNSDLHSASRALWMMKMFGHNPFQLYVLDGGLAAWKKYNGKTVAGTTALTPKSYQAQLQSSFICTLAQMKQNVLEPRIQVVDLRHPVRFSGGREPRPHMRTGHIPNSFSLPYFCLFTKEGGFKPLEKIRQLLTSIGLDLSVPIIATCGAGITAPILDFTLDLLEHQHHTVYAGSWAEWGADRLYAGEQSLDERPVETCLVDNR